MVATDSQSKYIDDTAAHTCFPWGRRYDKEQATIRNPAKITFRMSKTKLPRLDLSVGWDQPGEAQERNHPECGT